MNPPDHPVTDESTTICQCCGEAPATHLERDVGRVCHDCLAHVVKADHLLHFVSVAMGWIPEDDE